MVGGYAILCNRVFTVGEHDLVEFYGSFETAANYIEALLASGKPILVSCLIPNGVLTGWLQLTATSGTFEFGGIGTINLVRDDSTKTLKLQIIVD